MSKEIEEYFNNKVEEEVKRRVSTMVANLESAIQDMYIVIVEQMEEAKELHEDFKDQQLTVNSIEAEGGYRALLTLQNKIWAYYLPDNIIGKLKKHGFTNGNFPEN